jgi:peptidoglycan/xylan/chitin deacetylase (PgdA/CDA1 family)
MPPRINRRLRTGAYRAIYALGRFVGDGGITILSYHSLDRHGTPLSVPPRLFAAHMETLAREGCPTFTMSEVIDHLALQLPFPPRAVAVTFDDAFANVAEVAVPILTRHSFSATVYVITGMVGKVTRWTDRGDPLPPLPIMSWGQIESLSSSGIEVGSHSVSHGFLTTCTSEDLRCEMADSKATLQSRLGVPVTHFAYPQGDYNESVKAAAREAGYASAVTVDQGRASPDSDPFALPRLLVSKNTSPAAMRAFTVSAVGPAYRLANLLMRRLKGQPNWPRRAPGEVDSTGVVK